jgi:transcriptional regulator with XRE-family HTH domain
MYRPDHGVARIIQYLGLTQVDLAGYLGVSRDQLTGYVADRQSLPMVPNLYLVQLYSKVPPAVLSDPAYRARRLWPADPPLLLAEVLDPAAPGGELQAGPLHLRMLECQLQAHRVRLEIARVSRRLAQALARQQVLPALRADPGFPAELRDDARETRRQRWLDWLEQDTAYYLQEYDRTAQALRVLRAESLETEAARLQALLDTLPPAAAS